MQTSNATQASDSTGGGSGEGIEHFELRFSSLFNPGRGLSFPCDAQGHVNMDEMSERARQNYLYARAVMGREYTFPMVERSMH